jgi:flagellar basal-body rod protein FlgG
MIRSMYESASGMMAQMARQLAITNNLSNVSTPGYKAEQTSMDAFKELFLNRMDGDGTTSVGTLSTAVRLDQPKLDLSQGALVETGRPLDLAIAGDAFFAVQTPDGVQYTRNGSFQRDASGQLTTLDGLPVLGANGPISVPDGTLQVDADGTLSVNGQTVDKLQLVAFGSDAQLTPQANGLYASSTAGTPSPTAGVSQGFLEQSNVDINQTMVDMLSANRSYAMAQRMLQLADQSLGTAVNDVGKVG